MFKLSVLLACAIAVLSCDLAGPSRRLGAMALPKHDTPALEQDFDLLVSSLKEAHAGIYWYSTEAQFDALVAQQRKKLLDGLNELELYNIVAPIVAFTREDHCDINLSEKTSKYLQERGTFLPLAVMHLGERAYILNRPGNADLRGWELVEINGRSVEDAERRLFTMFGADGYILTSKYRYLDGTGLAVELAKTFGQFDKFKIAAVNPKTNAREAFELDAVDGASLRAITKALRDEGVLEAAGAPASLELRGDVATLTVNTLSNKRCTKAGMSFRDFVAQSFETIRRSGIHSLILDIRDNGGGSEGNEDYLFSYLTDKPYHKYKYVQASAMSYSFYRYTDYSAEADYKHLEADLQREHERAADGRFLRRARIEAPEPIQPEPFRGKLYVLISGWTYSGGAELASLIRAHTDAVFIGEETGGGFYGNSSGYILTLTLPNTRIEVKIPLLKFVLDVKADIPEGRGVLPQFGVEPTIDKLLSGEDAQMQLASYLIAKQQPGK